MRGIAASTWPSRDVKENGMTTLFDSNPILELRIRQWTYAHVVARLAAGFDVLNGMVGCSKRVGRIGNLANPALHRCSGEQRWRQGAQPVLGSTTRWILPPPIRVLNHFPPVVYSRQWRRHGGSHRGPQRVSPARLERSAAAFAHWPRLICKPCFCGIR